MIKVTISQNSHHQVHQITVDGHAGYAEYGYDIVCSAVSILVINTFNAIERFTKDEFETVVNEDTGFLEFTFRKPYGHDTDILIQTMIVGLQEVEDDKNYTDYIDLLFEEV